MTPDPSGFNNECHCSSSWLNFGVVWPNHTGLGFQHSWPVQEMNLPCLFRSHLKLLLKWHLHKASKFTLRIGRNSQIFTPWRAWVSHDTAAHASSRERFKRKHHNFSCSSPRSGTQSYLKFSLGDTDQSYSEKERTGRSRDTKAARIVRRYLSVWRRYSPLHVSVVAI